MLKVNTKKGFCYGKVEFDEDGWADAKKFLPNDYDLCHLKVRDKGIVSGWAMFNSWDGLNVDKTDEVLFWKRNKENLKD